MTITDILEQAKKLTRWEREELARQLLTLPDQPEPSRRAKTGAEIVAMLEAMDEPVEFVDPQLDDPVAWVTAQRHKRHAQLSSYWNADTQEA
ncbi:MAG: hypothetical protein HC911_16650 [Chloroflexaceae bacterium]|nr:hypothetical protein [Chloroflexaceae bacterium]